MDEPTSSTKGSSSQPSRQSSATTKGVGSQRSRFVLKKKKLSTQTRPEDCDYSSLLSDDKRIVNTKCLFYELTDKDVDSDGLTKSEINEARQTGVLKLSHRYLIKVPDIVWSIEILTEEEKKTLSFRFDDKEAQPWWTYKNLESLDLSHNCLKQFCPKGTIFYSLKELYINNNSLTKISDEIGRFQELRVLSVNDNDLNYLPKNVCDLKNLVELRLQRNYLETLPEELGNLFNLKILDISFNKIVTIPYYIGYLTSLVELNMSYNNISVVPEEIQSLRAVKILDFSNNSLSTIPNLNDMANLTIFNGSSNNICEFINFCGCQKLVEIHLQNNMLKELVIDNLQGVPLNKLWLQNNKLISLPEDIFRLSTLTLLDISKNQLNRLPYRLAHLRNLSCLKVDDNPLEDIRTDILRSGTARILSHLKRQSIAFDEGCDKTFTKGKRLSIADDSILFDSNVDDIQDGVLKMNMRTNHCLVLSNMKLSQLSASLLQEAKKEEVFRIDLSKNEFTSVPDRLEMLAFNLTEIILKQNNLRVIPDFIGQMKRLLYFDISNNKLESLPLGMATCRLKTLIAECNCFSMIPEVVYAITSLETINFRDNKITKIDVDGLKNLKNLYSLDLGNNSIQEVPPELGYLKYIKDLYLFGNPFKLPRYEVLSKGTEAVMAYLRNKIS